MSPFYRERWYNAYWLTGVGNFLERKKKKKNYLIGPYTQNDRTRSVITFRNSRHSSFICFGTYYLASMWKDKYTQRPTTCDELIPQRYRIWSAVWLTSPILSDHESQILIMAEGSRQNIVNDRHVGDRDCFYFCERVIDFRARINLRD